MRTSGWLLIVLAVAAFPAGAVAKGDPSAKPVLDRLVAAKDAAARQAAVEDLASLDPIPVAELTSVLERTRTSAEVDRRSLLVAKGFDIPDEKGRFRTPGRQPEKEEKDNDVLDWLPPLYADPASPALSDVLVDIAVIRALAASKDPDGATAILEFGFSPDGLILRDECGRYLRRMAPYSLPALIYLSERPGGNSSMARYARYQLERLDRETPHKALSAVPTDALKIEVLEAFAESQHREAVYTVLDTVDHPSPDVRAAARAAWMEYATGKPPRPAPKQKLVLPGGKLTDEEMPLYLDHRELATIAIRRLLEKLTGTAPERKATLKEMSEQLFGLYDERRLATLEQEMKDGLAALTAGDAEAAAVQFDRILVQMPSFHRRGEMAPAYIALGDKLAKDNKWREAAREYAKGHAVAPDGPLADKALAAHHEARSRALESEGKSVAAEDAREQAREAGSDIESPSSGRGLLLGGIGAGGLGLVLIGLGIVRRRRR